MGCLWYQYWATSVFVEIYGCQVDLENYRIEQTHHFRKFRRKLASSVDYHVNIATSNLHHNADLYLTLATHRLFNFIHADIT
jgi:hypothetical protein